jgi:hypothetical protein
MVTMAFSEFRLSVFESASRLIPPANPTSVRRPNHLQLFRNPITTLACPCLLGAVTISRSGDDAERVGSNAGQAARDAIDRPHGGDRSGAG